MRGQGGVDARRFGNMFIGISFALKCMRILKYNFFAMPREYSLLHRHEPAS